MDSENIGAHWTGGRKRHRHKYIGSRALKSILAAIFFVLDVNSRWYLFLKALMVEKVMSGIQLCTVTCTHSARPFD